MEEAEFKKLVKEAILELPEKIRQKIDNCAICLEKKPTAEQLRKTGAKYNRFLLGLYEGVPKTTYGRGFGMRLPDKITIFQESVEEIASLLPPHSASPHSVIEKFASTSEKIKELVKNTVWHEMAHHFGFNEKEVRELERKRKK